MAAVKERDRLRDLIEGSEPFLRYLVEWEADLPTLPLQQVVDEAGGPAGVALHAVDVTIGFCNTGRLASPRVGAIVPPIVDLFQRAHDLGVKHFVLPQDAHQPGSPEFKEYGAHCIVGTREAETMPSLRSLPFSDLFVVVPKRSISTSIATELEGWLAGHPEVTRHVVVGDCTDICIYQHAMHLKMRANALGIEVGVVVPEECVRTYDLPVETAQQTGATPHDGDLLHLVFLYHMALNGIQVVRALR